MDTLAQYEKDLKEVRERLRELASIAAEIRGLEGQEKSLISSIRRVKDLSDCCGAKRNYCDLDNHSYCACCGNIC